jgi:hypothetical protein
MNLDNNFWKEFPELIFPEPLNKLYTSDKSKDKAESSKIMWAVYMVSSPSSMYYNHPNKEEVIARDFLKEPKFKWSSIQNILDFYKTGILSIAEQSLTSWNDMMRLRDSNLKELYKQASELGLEGLKELGEIDKMMANTAKMFADYKKIKEDFDVDKTKGKVGKVVSLADEDDI